MPLATWKDLCVDAADAELVGRFWAAALGQDLELLDDGDAVVRGPRFADIWVNTVPEAKTGKNRVHLDLHAHGVDPLIALGAQVLARHDGWTVLADPEGNELCVMPGDPGDAPARAFAVCVDSAHPVELAAWWQQVLGGTVGPGPDGRPRWLDGAAGLDGVTLKAVQVDDPRLVKNRWHWDVTTADLDALVAAGATVLRPEDGSISWTICADPHGNEFCAFPAP